MSDELVLLLVLGGSGAIFALVGFIIIGVGVRQKKKLSRINVPIQALCIDLKVSRRSVGDDARTVKVYAPVWQYDYYGQIITVQSKIASNIKVPTVGQYYTIYINENNPYEFKEGGKNSAMAIFYIVFGAIFAIIGIALIVAGFIAEI